ALVAEEAEHCAATKPHVRLGAWAKIDARVRAREAGTRWHPVWIAAAAAAVVIVAATLGSGTPPGEGRSDAEGVRAAALDLGPGIAVEGEGRPEIHREASGEWV